LSYYTLESVWGKDEVWLKGLANVGKGHCGLRRGDAREKRDAVGEKGVPGCRGVTVWDVYTEEEVESIVKGV
jgi:hypothetical protein